MIEAVGSNSKTRKSSIKSNSNYNNNNNNNNHKNNNGNYVSNEPCGYDWHQNLSSRSLGIDDDCGCGGVEIFPGNEIGE